MGYVLKNMRLIDGNGGQIIENAVIVVDGTKIKAADRKSVV